MDRNMIPDDCVVVNEDEAIDLCGAGSVRGNGFMLTVYDEFGNEDAEVFMTKTQLEALVTKGQELLASGWADGPDAAV